jgi:aminoglycoside phosphotransferase (APT) family kinase protein
MLTVQDALEWVTQKTGQRVVRTRRLIGGITSDVRALTLGTGETLVLRRYTEWGAEAAEHVKREAAALTEIEGTDLPAPRLVAAKPTGPVPMLLMTRVPGRVDLAPRDQDRWLAQMARALVVVHATGAGRWHRQRPRIDPAKLRVPGWTSRPDLWERAVATLSRLPEEDFAPCFVHGDFQLFNMHWSRGRLTGLVDWALASTGHPDSDAAHCRLNLAVLYSVDLAERFRKAFEAESGHSMDPWWDLRGIVSYDEDWKRFIPVQVAGRVPVDTIGMHSRVEDLMTRILTRM